MHIPERIACDRDIDFRSLAQKYLLTGGYIKNSVIAALHRVFERDNNQLVLTHEDLEYGAKLQSMEIGVDQKYYKVIKPKDGPESLKLPELANRKFYSLIRIAQRLETEAVDCNDDSVKGLKVMLWGDRPDRRSIVAYAAAARLKRNVMEMHLSALSMEGHREIKKMNNEFFERAAATNDVIIVVDDCHFAYLGRPSLPEWIGNLLIKSFRQYRGLAFFAGGRIPAFTIDPFFHVDINLSFANDAMQMALVNEWIITSKVDKDIESDIKLQLLKLDPYQFTQFQQNVKLLSLAYDSQNEQMTEILREALLPISMLFKKSRRLF